MNKTLNKISSPKVKSSLTVILLLIFLLLSVGKEQLHNHKLGEPERDDCPALIISQSFSSGITVHFELPPFQIVEFYFDIPNHSNPHKSKLQNTNLRAPPLI